ncbi:hypothetical protein [Methanosarcina sp. 2.H.A.1B.4]|nr:hypothetical protein [Methanosarcina sp. 2.H.A.1B.4]
MGAKRKKPWVVPERLKLKDFLIFSDKTISGKNKEDARMKGMIIE